MRVGGLPAGQFVAGHRMGADVALPQPGSLDLIADHALDRAHVGERGVRMIAHERGQGGEDCGHRLERIAQHDHIRLGIHEFGERALAENAIGFGLGVGVRAMVPRDDAHAALGQAACERAADQSESDDSDCIYHSSSFLASSVYCQPSGARLVMWTPPSGSIQASTGGFGRSRRG